MKITICNLEMGKGSGSVGDKCKCKLKSGEEFVKKEYFEFDIFPGYSFNVYTGLKSYCFPLDIKEECVISGIKEEVINDIPNDRNLILSKDIKAEIKL